MKKRHMTLRTISILFSFIVFVISVGFCDECDSALSIDAMLECSSLRLRAADREMEDVINKLNMTENVEFIKALTIAQEFWKKWRDAEVQAVGMTVSDQSISLYMQKKQAAQMTEDRIKDLRSYSIE